MLDFLYLSAPGLLPKPSMSIIQLFRESIDSVHLKCDTTVRFANISWLQNGKPLNSCRRIQLSNNNQTLTIQPVLRRDTGAYQCHISNPLSTQRSDTTTISVIFFILGSNLLSAQAQATKYNLPVFMNPSNAIEGQGINLTVRSAPAAFFICNWYRGGSDSKRNLIVTLYLPPLSGYDFGPAYTGRETPGPNCSLHIENLSQDDSGTYTVTQDGSSVHGRGDISMEVIDGPDTPVIKMTAMFLTQRSNRRLNCRASSFPEAEYRWFQNGKEFSKNADVLLKNIQSGTYTCQATNPFTQQKENTTLEIE
ncbi:PREDICTED: carcinoembryonic antigen-related cell adhesion molecule 1-like [Thamnophis sirtalis]|uniref:Carcinoembryonic antigen-related cell adhesion molecule 1-like n=1 Tax=Thamnophis sirtalis TaxID=35019 RepID=A0A6I9Z1P5_9SAUR|nr:PREDICTED: carcinoembryonic antigen-related cell adhesion molecule 1-like [Thamnophis sirtalis]